MSLERAIKELNAEKVQLEAAIASLESLAARGISDNAPGRRGRKSMGEAERRVVSARMKKYWEDWRTNKARHAAATG